MIELVAVVVIALGVAVSMAAYVYLREARERHDERRLAEAHATGRGTPQSLHPVIDPDVCIGSLACVKACPEGDILGIVGGAGTLIHGANCIGHGRCAAECPVDAIRLVFGTSERGVDLPEVDAVFESSRAGIHIVGELGGMGLIKNAMTQGVQAGRHLATLLSAQPSPHPVIIVGAGPAGLATGLALAERRVPFRILDQQSVGGTVANYPRQKLVMTERVDLPLVGKFGKRRMSKEDLLAAFERVIAKTDLPLTTGVKVTGIRGADGQFVVQTSEGEVPASKVVLAVGRRGTPRKLGVPGEDAPHVTYRLIDPEQYQGSAVLVVGGGDSALEAAIQLAEAGDVRVSISYRGPDFVRCRSDNREKIAALIDSGRVRALLATEAVEINPRETTLKAKDGSLVSCPADYVIVQAGGELPLEFLKAAGIEVRRYFGEALGARQLQDEPEHTMPMGWRPPPPKPAATADDVRARRWLAAVLTVVGVGVVVGLAWMGGDYYALDRRARMQHPEHAFLRSSGPWGHGVGLAATAVMLANFFYAARKRWEPLKTLGNIRSWLTVHMFVGFMSPIVIAFHAAFQSNNVLATATSGAVAVVVLTGMVGRYIYGWVPATQGRVVELADLRGELERLKSRLVGASRLDPVFERVLSEPEARGSLLGFLLRAPGESLRFAWAAARARRSDVLPEGMLTDLASARKLRGQIGFYRSLRRLLRAWRVFHVVLAIFLVVAIAVHVGVTVYLGYGWGWSKDT